MIISQLDQTRTSFPTSRSACISCMEIRTHFGFSHTSGSCKSRRVALRRVQLLWFL